MKDIATIGLVCAPAIICVAAATYLAAIGADGWGWFLFVGLLLGGAISVNSNTEDKK